MIDRLKKRAYSFLNKNWLLALLVLVSLIPLTDLLTPGLFVAHDTQDHVARIASFYTNLNEGNVIPRWAGNLNWGYGHPILMFLYPLPSYVASLFHFLGVSLIDSTKIVFALGFVLSGATMYIWIRELFKDKGYGGELSGLVAGILYMFAPYRFVDLYVRGAIGENFFFIWPPLVLYFITKLSKEAKSKYIVGGALSLSAMILSHNALSIMYIPFIFVYALILFLTGVSKRVLYIVYCSLIAVFGFALSSFFWIPAYFEGKYTLRDIVTEGEIFKRFESFSRLVYSEWSYDGTGMFSVQVGIMQWAMILITPFVGYFIWKKIKKSKIQIVRSKYKREIFLLMTLSVFFWGAIFMMLDMSKPVYQAVTIFQKFQFSWRWLSLAIFPPAVLSGFIVYYLASYRLKILFVLICFTSSLALTSPYWSAKAYREYPEDFFTSTYHGTTDTGESSPKWSVRFMEQEPLFPIEVVEGEAQIQTITHNTTHHKYFIETEKTTHIKENTLYFPGWVLYLDGEKKPVEFIEFQDQQYHGIMTFTLPSGAHTIDLIFEETMIRKAANSISFISAILLFGTILLLRKRIS